MGCKAPPFPFPVHVVNGSVSGPRGQRFRFRSTWSMVPFPAHMVVGSVSGPRGQRSLQQRHHFCFRSIRAAAEVPMVASTGTWPGNRWKQDAMCIRGTSACLVEARVDFDGDYALAAPTAKPSSPPPPRWPTIQPSQMGSTSPTWRSFRKPLCERVQLNARLARVGGLAANSL